MRCAKIGTDRRTGYHKYLGLEYQLSTGSIGGYLKTLLRHLRSDSCSRKLIGWGVKDFDSSDLAYQP